MPTKLTEYLTIEDRIDAGSFGTVYRVTNALDVYIRNDADQSLTSSTERFALTTLAAKIFPPSTVFVKGGQISHMHVGHKPNPALLVELDIALGVRHEYCVRSVAAGSAVIENHLQLFLLMVLAETSLKKRLESGPLPQEEAVEMAEHIASALWYCHHRPDGGKPFVHRDVKPGNILFFRETRNGHVSGCWKLADFGIGRLTAKGDDTPYPAGTPPYMAPEAFLGIVNPACDVWSLGITLGEALGADRAAIAEDPSNLLRSLPAGLVAILRGCLEREPKDRWPMERVVDELRRYRGSISLELILDHVRNSEPRRAHAEPSRRNLTKSGSSWYWFVLAGVGILVLLIWLGGRAR